MNIYGVISRNEGHIDVSKSERGAKNYATRHGYTEVSIRFNCGYNVLVVAKKVNGRWQKAN